MKQFLQIVCLLILFSGISFAQGDLDLSDFNSVKALEDDMEPFLNAFQSGLSVLTWTSGDAPDVFGISIGAFAGFGSIEKNPAIGIPKDVFFPSTLGIQLGLGTAGFEAYARFAPEIDTDGASVDGFGIGLKYDISDLIPVSGFPSASAYVEYNTMNFGISGSTVYTDQTTNLSGTISNDIELGFSTINVGAVVGYDLVILGVYGKIGVEMGNSELSWTTGAVSNGIIVADTQKGDISNTNLRYAVGLSLLGIKAEIGGRGASTAIGLGYGISF